MVIILDEPFSLGDISTVKYPHVYASSLQINGPAQTVTVVSEVGTVQPDGSWASAPAGGHTQFNLTGAELYPFFFAKPATLDTPLWDQTEALVYAQIQAKNPRYAGKLGTGLGDDSPVDAPKPPVGSDGTPPAPDAAIPEEVKPGLPDPDAEAINAPPHMDGAVPPQPLPEASDAK